MTNEEYLNSLPGPDDRIDVPERIVCAANKYGDLVITGVRHGCDAMCDNLEQAITLDAVKMQTSKWLTFYSNGHGCSAAVVELKDILGKYQTISFKHRGEIQGFLTNKYRFVDRYEAWKIALDQRQIIRICHGNDSKGGKLFSENLY